MLIWSSCRKWIDPLFKIEKLEHRVIEIACLNFTQNNNAYFNNDDSNFIKSVIFCCHLFIPLDLGYDSEKS